MTDTNEMNANDETGQGGDRYTVPSTPPVTDRSQRRSKWAELFEECREVPGVWRRTIQSFNNATAAQIASDVRSAWRRDPAKMRMRGLRAGERWEVVSGPDPDGSEPGRHFLWLRFLGADSAGERLCPTPDADGIEFAW